MGNRTAIRGSLRVVLAVYKVKRLRFTSATEAYFASVRADRQALDNARAALENVKEGK